MHVLLAGSGYVGQACAEVMRARGWRASTLRRSPGSAAEGSAAPSVIADVTQPQTLRALPGGVEALVYGVSPDQRSDQAYRAAYVDGLQHTLDALQSMAAPLRRVVLLSSTAVYGDHAGGWVDERTPTAPLDFAGQRLLEAERMLSVQATKFGLTPIVLRLAGIYGPSRDRIVRQVATGAALAAGEPRFGNRIHRDDAAALIAHLLALPTPENCYLGVDDEPADMSAVYRWVAEQLDVELKAAPTFDSAASSRPTANKRCSNRRVRDTGFVFRFPSFTQGYLAAIALHRQQLVSTTPAQ